MVKTLGYTVTAVAAAAMTAGVPYVSVSDAWLPSQEPGSMLLVATAFFGLASAMRRVGKSARKTRASLAGTVSSNPPVPINNL